MKTAPLVAALAAVLLVDAFAVGRATAPFRARLAASEAQVRSLRRSLDALEVEVHGAPLSWPADTPAAFRPGTFEGEVRRAWSACVVGFDVVRFECAEPPCLVVVRTGPVWSAQDDLWLGSATDCPLSERIFHGAGRYVSAGVRVCPDGSREGYLVLAPRTSWLEDAIREKGRANWNKRLSSRVERIKEDWVCRPDGGGRDARPRADGDGQPARGTLPAWRPLKEGPR